MKNFFKNHWPVIGLLLVTVAVFVTNYKSGTYLAGWDTLQTELNPTLAIKRALFSVWEEYQSFGLVSGMAHASDLVRSIVVWMLALVLPNHMVRYTFHIFLWFLGGLGMFRLLEGADKKKPFAFLGALFYMLNFGIIQLFFVPFEPFSIFFAALPWEIWGFLRFVNRSVTGPAAPSSQTVLKQHLYGKLRAAWDPLRSRHPLLILMIINIFATPQAYLQTLFAVYISVLSLLSLGLILAERNLFLVKRILLAFVLIGVVNLFWILPQVYFLKTSAHVIKEAKINQLATEDVYYQNKEKGTLPSFVRFEGFYTNLAGSNQQPLFAVWNDHFSRPFFQFLPWGLYGVIMIGLFQRNRYRLPMGLVFLFVSIVLLSNTPGFSLINNFLRQNSLISQVFRSPFTKFVVPYALVASFFFAAGTEKLAQLGKRQFVVATLIVIILANAVPAFRGNFFSPTMKVAIPDDYFSVMNYFKTVEKNKRIALLPDYTFWGWFHHKWGFDGSGFLWYGIEQPIVSRTFDVWSEKSEGYFWEVKAALESEDVGLFESVLKKYRINYLLVDYSLLPMSSTAKSLQYDRTDELLHKSRLIHLEKKWKNLALYSVDVNTTDRNFINVISGDLPNGGPQIKLTNHDQAFIDMGNYKSDATSAYQRYYPFLDLMSQTRINNKRFAITEDNDSFIFKSQLSIDPNQYDLIGPTPEKMATFFVNNTPVSYTIPSLETTLLGKTLTVKIKKTSLVAFNPKDAIASTCAPNVTCFGYDGSFLEQRYGYLVKINNKNAAGRRLFFYIQDKTKTQAVIEDRLINDREYYLLSPSYQYGLGYRFVFQNQSYQGIPGSNKLENLEVFLLPFDQIQRLYFQKKNTVLPTSSLINSDAQKINYFTYAVKLKQTLSSKSTIILNQAFDKGWKAYVNGHELKNHVLVNNWENGWSFDAASSELGRTAQDKDCINQKCNVTIIFWPQYLEFVGFAIVVITLLLIARNKRV